MSNRGRQNVASYLALDLGIDWRLGADWFESVLTDYGAHLLLLRSKLYCCMLCSCAHTDAACVAVYISSFLPAS